MYFFYFPKIVKLNIFFIQVVESFDADDAMSIKSAQEVMQNPQVLNNLAYIKSHFHALPKIIRKLETGSMPLTESMSLVTDAIQLIQNVPGDFGRVLKSKYDAVINRNPDFNVIAKIYNVLKGETIEGPEEVQPQYWSRFKYSPITSCDVERSFSAYKLILTDKRHQFTVQNLEKTLVIYCGINYN